jgi:hypothetical protein
MKSSLPMNSVLNLKSTLGLLGLVSGLFAVSSARADLSYFVDINTSSIVNHPTGPFSIDFQSIYGSGLAQTFTVSNLSFTNGGLMGSGTAVGAVSGNLTSSLALNPSSSSFLNDFFQGFDPTVTDIKFQVNLTTHATLETPTSFSVSILDIPTSGVGDSLLLVNIDGVSNALQTATGLGVTVNVTAVPEPSTYGLAASIAALITVVCARRRRT